MKYAARTDANHAEIRQALRDIGVGVHDTSSAGKGLPDLLCVKDSRIVLVEVKNGKRPPSARELTVAQKALRATLQAHGSDIAVVTNIGEALALFGAQVMA